MYVNHQSGRSLSLTYSKEKHKYGEQIILDCWYISYGFSRLMEIHLWNMLFYFGVKTSLDTAKTFILPSDQLQQKHNLIFIDVSFIVALVGRTWDMRESKQTAKEIINLKKQKNMKSFSDS